MTRAEQIASVCEAVARRFWGLPNEKLSSAANGRRELRWGTHGARSLDSQNGRWFDHERGEGGSTLELVMRERSLPSRQEAEAWLEREGLLAPENGTGKSSGGGKHFNIVATYDYMDETGALLFQVVRLEPKEFLQRRPNDRGGWKWNTQGVRRVLYRLPELREAIERKQTVFVVEGEKDADNLRNLGFAATCNPGGASKNHERPKWRSEYTEMLRGGDAVVVSDNDEAGRAHADHVAAALHGATHRVRLLDLAAAWPDCPVKGDISDWLAAGHTRHELEALVARLPDWQPVAAAATEAPQIVKAKKKASQKKRSQADVLLELALSAALFHTPDGTGFADLIVNEHRETWPIKSRGFRRWLGRLYFDAEHKAIRAEAMQSVIGVLEAKAQFDAPEHQVHVRVAQHGGRVYIDLADKEWRAIDVSASGWTVVSRPPVRFRRAKGMLPLPAPVSGSSINGLRQFLNIKTDAEFVLAVSCVLAYLCGQSPYPVLVICGEHGAAKSTIARMLRSLYDPNTAPLRALPHSERDLAISANNSYAQVFENISSLPDWLSDALARLATGGGLATRELYTDDEEVLFDATRPVMLNGIEDFVVRPDLADRTVLLTLQNIPDDRRKLEKTLWSEFERERPGFLGALLEAAAHGLRELPQVNLGRLPRMADFAHWATACETALWPAGTFMAAYRDNIAGMVDSTLEASLVAEAVREFIAAREEWEGTSKDLLMALTGVVGEVVAKRKQWPGTPRKLSGRLRRDAPGLRRVGIEIVFGGEGRKRRAIRITAEKACREPSPPSPQSPPNHMSDLAMTLPHPQPAPTVTPIVTSNRLNTNDGDGGDGGDGILPALSTSMKGHAGPDGLCDHCGGPATAANPLNSWNYGRPDGISLHSRCEAAWFDAEALQRR